MRHIAASGVTLLLFCLFLPGQALRAEFIGVDFGPGATPQNWNAISGSGVFSGLTDLRGRQTGVSLRISNAGDPFGITPQRGSVPGHSAPGARQDLTAIDGNLYQFGGVFSAELEGLQPLTTYNFYLFGLRGGASLQQQVALKGATEVSFMQVSSDGMLAINDQEGSSQRSLTSYAREVVSSAQGTIRISVTGGGEQGSPFVVAGLAVDGPAAAMQGTAGQSTTMAESTSATGEPAAPAAERSPQTTGVAAAASGPDVVGVYLGMPLEAAFNVVKQTFPAMPLRSFQADVGQIYRSRLSGLKYPGGFSGSFQQPETNESITVLGFSPPNDGRVSAVARSSYLGEMLFTDLRDSLIAKYGEPLFEAAPDTIRNSPGYMLSWSRAKDGSPQRDPAVLVACSTYTNKRSNDMIGYIANLWDTEEQFNGQYDKCGFTMVVYAMQTDLPSIVRFYNIVLYDLPEIVRTTRATLDMAEDKAQAIESEREKAASGKKPIL